MRNFNDDCLEIVQAAATSAGATRDSMFIPILIRHLKTNKVRKYAREALAEYGEEVIDILAENLKNTNENRKIRLGIPKVLALIGLQKTIDVLIKNLKQSDLLLRFEIIKALNKLKVNFPNLKFDKHNIMRHIWNETKYYYKILCLQYQQSRSWRIEDIKSNNLNRAKIAQKLLIVAMEEKLDVNLERIFRLLGLRYPPKDMYNAYLGVISKKSDLRANAVEFLENILDSNSKRIIIPIIEGNSPNLLIEKSQQFFGFDLLTEYECLEFLLNGEDNWLKVCTLYFIAELKNAAYHDIVMKLITDSDPIVRETAQYYLNKLIDLTKD